MRELILCVAILFVIISCEKKENRRELQQTKEIRCVLVEDTAPEKGHE